MKAIIEPKLAPRRGGKVEVGNVYTNVHAGGRYYRLVVSTNARKVSSFRENWNKIVCLHIDALGNIIGCSMQPELYMSEHQDLIGKVKSLPDFKIEWLKEGK
jgi:hypothetical protein